MDVIGAPARLVTELCRSEGIQSYLAIPDLTITDPVGPERTGIDNGSIFVSLEYSTAKINL